MCHKEIHKAYISRWVFPKRITVTAFTLIPVYFQKCTTSAVFLKRTTKLVFLKSASSSLRSQNVWLALCFLEPCCMLTSIHVNQRHSFRLYVTLDFPLKVCVPQNFRQPLIFYKQKQKNYTTMSFISFTIVLSLFHSCPCCVWLEIVYKFSWYSLKCKKCAEGWKNCHLQHSSIRFRWLLKEKAFYRQESCQLQKWLSKIDDRMTKIKDLEDKVMSVKDAIDNNNPDTTESPTNDFILYHSVFSNKALTLSNHLAESNELLASFESIIHDSDFDLLGLSQFANLPTKDFVGENLIEL